MNLRTSVLTLLLLNACLTERRRDAGRDRDGDGFEAWELGGGDCDDQDPAIHPDAVELCGNGADDDCDGLVDDDGSGARRWYEDADSDGFPGSTPHEGCSPPMGSFTDLAVGVDCDDADAGRSPGLTEVWYDGVDQDCDGVDADQDADGFSIDDDCDDEDEAVNPESVELCNNGLDDDCDGTGNQCDIDAPRTIDDAFVTLGLDAVRIRILDANADGLTDLIVHEADRTLAYFAPLPRLLAVGEADLILTHPGATDGGDTTVDFGEFNGDDVVDWVVGDDNNARVAVWFSPTAANGRADLDALPSLVALPDGDFGDFGSPIRVVDGVNTAWGDALVVGTDDTSTLHTGVVFESGLRHYTGPWTGVKHANAPSAFQAWDGIGQLGPFVETAVVDYIPVVGATATDAGLFPVAVPRSTSDDSFEVGAPWLSAVEPPVVGLMGGEVVFGTLRRLSSGQQVPVFMAFGVGEDIVAASGLLPVEGGVVFGDRAPMQSFSELDAGIAVRAPIDAAVRPPHIGIPFLTASCQAGPWGDVVIAMLYGGQELAGNGIHFFPANSGTVVPDASTNAVQGYAVPRSAECGDVTGDGVSDLVLQMQFTNELVVIEGTSL